MDIRNKKFAKNGVWSLIQQVIAAICGLLLPQLILSRYGSSVNGVLASITQFLSFITLLQGGVGTVARIAFYKPLAEKSDKEISVAYKTVGNFFKRFAIIFTIYLILLAFFYPIAFDTEFSYQYVFWLVIVVGLASVSEFFWGQASQLLLYSDQKGYIYSIAQVLCLIVSTGLCCMLITRGASIHIVKLVYSLIFTIRPLALFLAVKKLYRIDSSVCENKNLLSQRNSALIRHIAFYIHTSTDVMVLTVFMNSLWVSVYSVHRYVVSCLSTFLTSILGNTEVVFGDMFAKNEKDSLRKYIPVYDLLTKYLSIVVYSTCIILISSFVQIYTKNVHDISYYYPLFAVLLVSGEMIYCMGITYQNVYIAAGHIKKTEWIAVTEALINILISIILVRNHGIVGVAIGTLVAMSFKTMANIFYMQKNVFKLKIAYLIKSNLVSFFCCFTVCAFFMNIVNYIPNTYIEFFLYAGIVFFIVCLFTAIIYFLCFKQYTISIVKKVLRK